MTDTSAPKKNLKSEVRYQGIGVEVPSVTLAGSVLDNVLFIEEASATLLVSTGEIDGSANKVLVPFVSLKLTGSKRSDDGHANGLFDEILTLEDASYLIADLTGEIASTLDELTLINSGRLKVENARVLLIKQSLEQASFVLKKCQILIEDLDTTSFE